MLRRSLISFLFISALAAFLILMINSAQRIALPVDSSDAYALPKVIIDAGHGGEDGGAVAADGTVEKDINLSIACDTADLLKFCGFEVTQTRTGDYSLSDSEGTVRGRKTADMKKRLEIYNSSENNVIISIHQNKFEQPVYNGTQIFYSPNNELSKELAENIRFTVGALLQPDNKRECKPADKSIYLLYNTGQPAVIAECGFISNPDELALLKTGEYQKQMSFAIVSGLLRFCNYTRM